MKKNKLIKKYKSGGFLKGLGNAFQNTGVLLADNALSTFGATDVLDNAYTNDKMGKGFTKVSKVTNQIQKAAGQIGATAIGGPMAGAAMGQLQNTVGGLTADPNKEITDLDVIGNTLGNIGGMYGSQGIPTMKNGGRISNKHLINVENKELLTDSEGNILKEYKNKPLHPKKGINSLGNTVEDSGNYIIPRKLANTFKEGDRLRRNSILMNLNRQEDTSLMMKKGGRIPKYFGGGTIGDEKPYNRGAQLLNLYFKDNKAFNQLGMDAANNFGLPDNSQIQPIASKPGLLDTPQTDLKPVLGAIGRTGNVPAMEYNKKPLMGPKTANTLSDIGGLALNNLGPSAYLLSQGKRYDKVDYGQVKPEFTNPNEELLGAQMENSQLNQDIKNYSGGNSGTYLANRQAGSSRNLLNRNKIIRDYANTNTGIANQFKQYNKSIEMKSMDDTARNKGQALTNYFSALSNLGANTAQGIGDIRKRKSDEKRLNLYEDIFSNYDFDPVNYTFTKKKD